MKRMCMYGFVMMFVMLASRCGNEAPPPQKSNAVTAGEKAATGTVDLPLVKPGAAPVELANIDAYVGERSKTEGPVADSEGNVYFSDPYGPKLYKWSPETGLQYPVKGTGSGWFTNRWRSPSATGWTTASE